MGKEIVSRTTFVKGVTACVVVAASLGIIKIGDYAVTSSEETATATTATTGSASYTPGTYTATSAGISSDVSVTCTFDESSITAIEIDVSGETADIGAAIGDEMIEQFMAAQSSAVDGVSGATVTSDALKAALEDCIAQATGGSSDEGEEAITEEESEKETAEVTETETESVAEADEKDEEAEAETEDLAEADEDVATDAAEADEGSTASGASFTPGTYTASAAGISSDVTVTCTFDETGLVEVTTDVSGETAGIGADIGDEMVSKVLEAQSADVDGVSGATVTSDAFKAAVADCMEQAGFTGSESGNEEAEIETEAETESTLESETEAETESTLESETEAAEASETEAETDNTLESETEAAEDASSQTSSSARYTPGTYTATAAGMESDVTVTITVDENSILSVGCNVSGETEGVGAAIGPEIIAQILDAQSADVDGVSGATVTSDAVKTAAADALSQAGGDAAEPSEEDTDDADAGTVEAETETADMEAEATEDETEAADADAEATEDETNAADADAEAAEDETEAADADAEAAEDETEAAASGAYTPGTYSASAAGIASDVMVTIIVDEDSILSVGYDLSGETDGIGADIGPEISAQILAAQSADIDGVSGATVTSDAVKSAIADCIAQAQAGTAAEAAADTEDDAEPESENETEADTDDAEAEEAQTELTSTDALEADYVSSFTPGTYSSTAEGYSAEITVTMTFGETSILEMDVDTSGETSTYALIDEDVIAQILEAQSVDVDGISGATATTDAILEAAADCIAQAQSDSAADIIGGTDGATAIFLAGEEDETELADDTELDETETSADAEE